MEDAPQMLEMFYEGKAKKLYATADPDLVIAYFKDDATAFNAKKRGTIEEKGVINNRMSELFFSLLEQQRRYRPISCAASTIVRCSASGSRSSRSKPWCAISWRARWPSGWAARKAKSCKHPIVEYYYKSDPLDDPLIYPEHAVLFGWATEQELDTIHVDGAARSTTC